MLKYYLESLSNKITGSNKIKERQSTDKTGGTTDRQRNIKSKDDQY